MDDDQQFCLRWNNHQSTLVAVFDTLLENGTLVDCTLAAEGKFLNAHKVVLSACSPYFETLLSQNYDKHPIFILKDVKFQELKAMMDYMYRGEVNISQDQLGALLKAAESLQIKGLSDNRKGESETKKTVVPPPAKSPTPQTSTIPKVQGLTIEQRKSRDFDDTREGSQSPGPRKRKRIRRKSTDDLDNHQDASNSSESHSSQAPPVQNIPSSLPAASTIANVPEPIETKSEILTRHKTSVASNESDLSQVPIIKEKIETHSEIMLEPKSEYVEEMNEEESIEDLTLDDDDLSNMELSGNQGAGPSHGNAGEGSSQGFGNWHMGNQNQDEVFLAAQEAVGAHRDSQDDRKKCFRCDGCNKKYSVKSTLARHKKYECGKEPMFGCPKCSYRGFQKTHVIKHLMCIHSIIWNPARDFVIVFKDEYQNIRRRRSHLSLFNVNDKSDDR
ncbi:longitudinals lacking protein, isoforms N/O/W/X/Y isoform X12 [Agrilus planipennis]|uniref:Longitudinals lacking protein, isoforms N/O/W/X/Y isoform X12 n=1 Tax=Agrilus planipennis TaxID=224129 RepID=A0A7F5RF56_AGRPL|nr:longitudinals lacking protein, isoforms N/O/W/X/Y isoform X12 [Agrilus planipennis]